MVTRVPGGPTERGASSALEVKEHEEQEEEGKGKP